MTSIVITLGALGIMYYCCIRPMRRGHDATARSCCSTTDSSAGGSDELAQLSREIDALRKSMEEGAGSKSGIGSDQS